MSKIPFDNRDGWIWQNGNFVPWRDAKMHVISQGLHYANSVFEGERAYNGIIFKSIEHTDRLFNSAKILGIINSVRTGYLIINLINLYREIS